MIRLVIYFALLALYVCGCAAGIAAGCSKRTIAALAFIGLFGMVQLYA